MTKGCLAGLDHLHKIGLAHSHDSRPLEGAQSAQCRSFSKAQVQLSCRHKNLCFLHRTGPSMSSEAMSVSTRVCAYVHVDAHICRGL